MENEINSDSKDIELKIIQNKCQLYNEGKWEKCLNSVEYQRLFLHELMTFVYLWQL